EAGATFSVREAGAAGGYSAPIGGGLGSWGRRDPLGYALDLDPPARPGPHTVSVRRPAPPSSPRFGDGAAGDRSTAAPPAALAFYQAERDGRDFIRSPLRTAPGHLNDRHAQTYLTPKVDPNGGFSGDLEPLGVRIDASGGWWDAGDYLKFVETTSYTVDLLL